MARVADGTLKVDGATIHYKTAGQGPVLLLLPGGDGDADAFDLSLPDLTDRFKVVVCDRRGLSRSALEDPLQEMSIERHADDALAVLATITEGPALVFGGSLGAVVALDIAARHPERVSAVVAFEPPLPDLLPDALRQNALAACETVLAALMAGGPFPAMRQFSQMAGVNAIDSEPGVPLASPQRAANFIVFLTRDATAVWRYRLDVSRLREMSDRIIPAAGINSADAWPHQAGAALAAALERPLVQFAGDHAGFVRHPRSFAARCRDLFSPYIAPA